MELGILKTAQARYAGSGGGGAGGHALPVVEGGRVGDLLLARLGVDLQPVVRVLEELLARLLRRLETLHAPPGMGVTVS